MTVPRPPRQSAEAVALRLEKTLGQNVKRARDELSMTQRDLAKAAGKSQRHIALIETTGANVTILTLAQLGKCLNKTVIELLTSKSRNPPL